MMVETRLLGRSHQVRYKGKTAGPTEYAAVLAERALPNREMLGEGQKKWLEGELSRSVKAGKPWQVLGNQVVMARVGGVDLEKTLGRERYAATLAAVPENYRARLQAAVASTRAGIRSTSTRGTATRPAASGSTRRSAPLARDRSCCRATVMHSGRTT